MLTDELAALIGKPRCTYPTGGPYQTCQERSEWVGRCESCGSKGDGMVEQTVCGEHRWVLANTLSDAVHLGNVRCGRCDRPLKIMWEQL